MDGTQRHLRDHRSVAFLDLLLCARKRIDGMPAGHIPEVTVERDHRLRWQFPLNDGFLLVTVREDLASRRRHETLQRESFDGGDLASVRLQQLWFTRCSF